MNPLQPELVRGWLAKAEEDLKLIEAIAGEADRFRSTIAFHAEQAAEKISQGITGSLSDRFSKDP